MLDNLPRTQLISIISQYGKSIIDNPTRCRGLLKDLAPDHKRETNLLLLALDEKLVSELTNTQVPLPILIERLAQRLHDGVGIQKEFAIWALESWGLAFNLIQQPLPKHNNDHSSDEVSRKKVKTKTIKASFNNIKDDDSVDSELAHHKKMSKTISSISITTPNTKLLDNQTILSECTTSSFNSGKNYFENGRVTNFKIEAQDTHNVHIAAKVKGSHTFPYKQLITLKWKDDSEQASIIGRCSCPIGYNCKHVVAACLEYKRRLDL